MIVMVQARISSENYYNKSYVAFQRMKLGE